MPSIRLACFVVTLAVAVLDLRAETPKRYIIPSWGDMTLVYGPGTDAAMDTPQAMENMVRHWKGRGFAGVYLRSDLDQFPPGEVLRHASRRQTNPGLAAFWRIVDEIMAKADPHVSIRKAADKLGFEYWVFHPHIYSEGGPEQAGVEGPGRMVPWSYMLKYHRDHPEVITVDREGNRQWMVPEYGYPGVRANKAAEFAHMAKTYRPTGIIASMRSETSQLIPPPEHADQYGFNQVVVDDMKRLYDVDILTDPRFDWKSPAFKSDDELVRKWRDLRGTYITQLYRDIRQAIHQANPDVQFAVCLAGEYLGPPLGNARLEWRKWIDEGIVDVLILGASCEATLDMESDKKAYLTNVRLEKGVLSAEQVKKYVLASKHPAIKVIQTGAPSYFYPLPPEGADGWQCDAWYDSYHVASYQRWEQWKKDLAERGSIRFFEQTFDRFAPKDPGIAGGIGDGRYHADLQACPGFWFTLGDATDARPYVQCDVRRGNTGAAIALTGKELTGVHYSSPDRGLYASHVDTAIANGQAGFSCWIYRANEQNSITAHFTDSAYHVRDVAVRVAAKTGRISYASGINWIEADAAAPFQKWSPICIEVDVDAQTYSAWIGEKKTVVCRDVPLTLPKHQPVTPQSRRFFNELLFIPSEGSKEPIYLDDIVVQWQPTMHFEPQGNRRLLRESFEDAEADATMVGRSFNVEGTPDNVEPFTIECTTSFGKGVRCLQAKGGGSVRADLGITPASAKARITVDIDVFLRSDKSFPFIMPDPTTRSPHSVIFGLESGSDNRPFAEVQAIDGTWRIWDGHEFVDSGKPVNYDVWNHVQLSIDPQSNQYRLVVQPVGEMPAVIGEGACDTTALPEESLRLVIRPSMTSGHVSCYDNIEVTMMYKGVDE